MSVANQSETVPKSAGLFAAYRGLGNVFDEATLDGNTRPAWDAFAHNIERIGRDGLRERQENARLLLREHGVTYNVNSEAGSAERTWLLDPLPLLISAAEWEMLETGLIQRTRLLNRVLQDLYGPRFLLRDGLLPPALIHANPGFLRPCHGVKPPGNHYLTLHAVDLIRSPDGRWWVLSDRTQAPSGVGYALENRIIVSRVLPDEFRDSRVQRLASFFVAQKDGLRAMAPWTDHPNVVLLTPGPLAETYFEHAYLARYLGYPLVEGSDLTVRDQRVFIKTLDGLQPVDVIIRRMDDVFCDPVELRPDSALGIPGLVEAARAGNVAISNSLGAGAVEAPAILAFLPALARRILGEELRIPNVATWWCGQARERAYTLAHLSSLVVKRAFVGGSFEPSFGENLVAGQVDTLAAKIRANPHAFVGQERVALSTAPSWNGENLEPRPLILRCFVCATASGYAVMPGGLTRVSASPRSPVVSSRYGGGSKDTWVLSEKPVENVTLLDHRTVPVRLERTSAHVPSRAAENLYWLGRYAERLEDTTRQLRIVLSRLAGEGGPAEDTELIAIARWLVWLDKLPARFSSRFPRSELTAAMRELVMGEHPAAIRHLLQRLGYLTASVRDRLSADTWRILNQMQTEFPEDLPRFTPGGVVAVLHRIIFQLAAFSGMEMENMTRGHAWRFLNIGRRLERAMNLTANLRAVIAGLGAGDAALSPLLEYADSVMTYRRRYYARPELPTTLDLLVADDANPRSLAFQFSELGEQLGGLPRPLTGGTDGKVFDDLQRLLAEADVVSLGAAAVDREPEPLERWLRGIEEGCYAVSDHLTASYFSHVVARVS